MIFKFFVKLLIKLLFFGRAAYEVSATEFKNKANIIKEKINQAEKEGDESIDAFLGKFSNLEDKLQNRVDGFQQKLMGVCSENNSEINELRAELAELRVELRELKRHSSSMKPLAGSDDE